MKMKANLSLKGFLILFSLLASAILTPSEYVDCRSLFPEEGLDFLGIFEASQTQCPVSHLSTLIASCPTSEDSWGHHLFLELFFDQSINSTIALATILRC
jgi:hypothetical protein